MLRSNRQGFTLIELLTVIAIIAILAAMVFVGFGRVREIAKLRSLDNTLVQLRTMLAAYYSQNSSYPVPIGGVMNKQNYADILTGTLDPASDYVGYWGTFQTRPYTMALGIADDAGLMDPFSFRGYDTDLKSSSNLYLMEYLPKGRKANTMSPPVFPRDLPTIGAEGNAEMTRLRDILTSTDPVDSADPLKTQRPFVYIAVNKNQAKIASRYWINNNDAYGTAWNWNDPALKGVTVPPASYDAFVLISQGPAGDTGGILADSPALLGAAVPSPNITNIGAATPENSIAETYYFSQLRAFYLATRDWDADGNPDLTYQGRNNRDTEYPVNGQSGKWNTLPPEALNPNGYGAYVLIYGFN